MQNKSYVVPALILLVSALNVNLGIRLPEALMTSAGTIGVYYLILQMDRVLAASPARRASQEPAASPVALPPSARKAVDANDTAGLVEQMLGQGRCALLLRRQIAARLDESQFDEAMTALREAMSLVSAGEVLVGHEDAEHPEFDSARLVHVQPFFLDRFAVTNRQYYQFVAAGGYRERALWDPAIWPAVADLVDASGEPGPRFWKNGCHGPGEEDLPVVGVSWYEAAACARWLGKRLPTDAEWVKAASWPVAVAPTKRAQRRYPWGDAMEPKRANLWGTGPGRPVSVREYPEGMNVGGAYQLIGNVWEWISGEFRGGDPIPLPEPLKSIRGGAFDTYFDSQATCQFQSGEGPLGRRHNIGFRCAVGVCDLLLAPISPGAAEVASPPTEEAPS